MRMTHLHQLAAVATAALVLSCSSDDPVNPNPGGGGGGGPVQTTAVDVRDNNFNPDEIQVAVGATVTWSWTTGTIHNVTFDDDTISDSGNRNSGTVQRTFDTAGTYTYECTIHPGMEGEVVVQ